MKKRALLVCFSSLCLASCVGETLNSSSFDSSSDSISSSQIVSSSSSSNVVESSITPKEAYSLIKKLASSSSYHISSGLKGNSPYEEWLSKGYYYNSSSNSGYVLKESFDSQYGDSIVYASSIEDGQVKLGAPQYSFEGGTLHYVNNLSSLHEFSSFNDIKDKIDANSFKSNDKGQLYCSSRDLITTFANAIGITSSTSIKGIDRIRFFKVGDGLGFALEKDSGFDYYYETFDSYTIVDQINDANMPILEDYVGNHYSLGEKAIDGSKLSLLDSSSHLVTLHNEAHVYIDSKDQGVNLASEAILSSSKAERITINPVDESSTSDLFIRHDDGYAYERGYNELGEIEEKKHKRYLDWSDLFPNLKDKILEEPKAFRLEDGEYVYYGRLTNRLKDFFGQMDISATAIRMALTLGDDGNVNGARFEFASSSYSDNGKEVTYHYVLESKVIDNKEFTSLSSLPSSEKIPELDSAISYFNGDRPYLVSFRDTLSSSDSERITYSDDTFLHEKFYFYSSGEKSFSYGYYKKGSGNQSFVKTKDDVYFARNEASSSGLETFLPHSLNSALFAKQGDYYVLKDHVLSYFSKGLPLDYNASNSVVSSVRLNLDSKGRIASLSYTFDWDIVSTRSEVATFSYDDVNLPDGITSSLASLTEFNEPTTWEEESSSIYEDLKKLYGDEASNIPYIYLEGTYKQWSSSYSIAEIVQISNSSTDGVDEAFFDKYRKALTDAGFVLSSNPSLPGAEEYNLGKIRVRLAKVLSGGLYFSLNE